MDTRALHHLWLERLRLEAEHAFSSRGIRLSPPNLEINHGRRVLGSWRPAGRTVVISRHLITGYPWSVTVGVLKHELAHQVCHELFGRPRAGHGPHFQRACDLLGVEDVFRSARGDLPRQAELAVSGQALLDRERRFIERIEKLLALAGSSNEHEAALAMRKAGELMERHNIRSLEEERRAGYLRRVIDLERRRAETWHRMIAALLRDHFFVNVILASTYHPLEDRETRTMELFGRRENALVAEHCARFLLSRLPALYEAARPGLSARGLRARNSYYLGLLRGFRERMDKERASGPEELEAAARAAGHGGISALVVAEDTGLQDFIRGIHPRLRKVRGRGVRLDSGTYERGRKEGRRLVLRQGLQQEQGNRGARLPGPDRLS